MSRRHPSMRIALLTLTLLLVSATVASAATGHINATNVRFRQGPSTSTEIIRLLDKDTRLEVLNKQGDWVAVKIGETSGFVYAIYVTNDPETALPVAEPAMEVGEFGDLVAIKSDAEDAEVDQPDEVASEIIAYVNANTLNIRLEASASSAKIGTLHRGNRVVLIEDKGIYSKIRTQEGVAGYALTSFLIPLETTVSRSGDNAKIDSLIDAAMSMLGVRYVHGGLSLNGTDCSGFVMMAYSSIGVATPRSSSSYVSAGVPVARENLMPGDVVMYDTRYNGGVGHVGIYLGNDKFIHASTTMRGVVIASFSGYQAPYKGARRFVR